MISLINNCHSIKRGIQLACYCTNRKRPESARNDFSDFEFIETKRLPRFSNGRIDQLSTYRRPPFRTDIISGKQIETNGNRTTSLSSFPSHRPKYLSSSFDGRSDREIYFLLCPLLKHSHQSEIMLEKLPYFPLISVLYNDEKNFCENYLLNWWSCLMFNRDKVVKTALSRSIKGLQKLNSWSNGKVLKQIKWNSIEDLAKFALQDIDKRFSSVSYESLLRGLRKFVMESKVGCSSKLRECLSSSLKQHILHQHREVELANHIADIFFSLKELGIEKPNDIDFNVCYLSLKLNYQKNSGADRLMTLHYLGESFLTWKINADIHRKDFWQKYFCCVEKHLKTPTSISSNNTISSFILKTSISIAYEFNKEDEFMKIQTVWKNEIKNCFKEYENGKIYPVVVENLKGVKFILQKLKDKHCHELQKIDTLLSADLVRKFDELN